MFDSRPIAMKGYRKHTRVHAPRLDAFFSSVSRVLRVWTILALAFASPLLSAEVDNSFGSLPPFTEWYQNPLGVSPIALHTANGIIVPAIAAGVIMLVTENDAGSNDRLSYFADASYTKGYYGSFTRAWHGNFGLNYMLRRYLSVGVEFTEVYVHDEDNNAFGFGLRPFFRFYPVNTDRFKLYFSSGAGLIFFNENFPQPSGFFGDEREGTRLNGCPKYGIGAEARVTDTLGVTAGLWHVHYSNGDHPGYERNPGHDGNGLSLGLTYTR